MADAQACKNSYIRKTKFCTQEIGNIFLLPGTAPLQGPNNRNENVYMEINFALSLCNQNIIYV